MGYDHLVCDVKGQFDDLGLMGAEVYHVSVQNVTVFFRVYDVSVRALKAFW